MCVVTFCRDQQQYIEQGDQQNLIDATDFFHVSMVLQVPELSWFSCAITQTE